jgi:putative membrane protein
MVILFAFLHHLAAFTIVATLVVELVLTRNELAAKNARVILGADLAFGVSAGIVLVAGILRALYFEKGAAYYFHSVPFVAKVSLFIVVGVLSIYPTVEFLSWRRAVKQGQVPTISDRKMRAICSIIHWELVGVMLMILCAVLMAKGVGYVA